MVKSEEEPGAVKLCSACVEELPNDKFSKKQWSAKRQRRCKDCVESDRDIDSKAVTQHRAAAAAATAAQSSTNPSRATATGTATTTTTTDNPSNKKKKKEKPAYAGNQKACYEPAPAEAGIDYIPMKLASEICAWCGKSEENKNKLMGCMGCRNILFCSTTCQKAAWPEHKLVCDQYKKDRKKTKKVRKILKTGAFSMSEASGVGSFFLDYHPKSAGDGGFALTTISYTGELRGDEKPGQYFATEVSRNALKSSLGPQKFPLFCQHMEQASLNHRGTLKRVEFCTEIDELNAVDQFLLSCGSLDDMDRAKIALPFVLNQIGISGLKPDGSIPNIGDITVRGYGLNALEWASRRGNHDIAEWLATDSRTKVMLTRTDSAPVAWACYTNKIGLAKMLVHHGANSHATTEVVFGYKPAMHLASENGSLLAVKFLVEDCGHDIQERDTLGEDMRASLRRNNRAWASVAGCVAVDEYAKSKRVCGG
mmetsp:Transcript_4488/g.7517  ORF Transcript_4488/g.7517 Transcript_4488/m.7517 type:complete len:481 (+) Transcript_4488:105-1547(+)